MLHTSFRCMAGITNCRAGIVHQEHFAELQLLFSLMCMHLH